MASISQLGMLVQQLIHTKCPIFFEKWAYLISEKGYYFYLFYRDLVNCFQFAGRAGSVLVAGSSSWCDLQHQETWSANVLVTIKWIPFQISFHHFCFLFCESVLSNSRWWSPFSIQQLCKRWHIAGKSMFYVLVPMWRTLEIQFSIFVPR